MKRGRKEGRSEEEEEEAPDEHVGHDSSLLPPGATCFISSTFPSSPVGVTCLYLVFHLLISTSALPLL